jgi:hypothetical protein
MLLTIFAVNRSRWWALPAVALLISACAGPGDAPPAAAGDSVLSGKCRYVTVAEMAEATGLPTVKPVETLEGCGYLYDPVAVMPSFFTDLDATADYEPMPPAAVVLCSDTEYAIKGVERKIADPKPRKVPDVGVGGAAASLEQASFERHGHGGRSVADAQFGVRVQ